MKGGGISRLRDDGPELRRGEEERREHDEAIERPSPLQIGQRERGDARAELDLLGFAGLFEH